MEKTTCLSATGNTVIKVVFGKKCKPETGILTCEELDELGSTLVLLGFATFHKTGRIRSGIWSTGTKTVGRDVRDHRLKGVLCLLALPPSSL